MDKNSKETSYLKLVRTPPEDRNSQALIGEQHQKFKQSSFLEKMQWRGINPSTAIIGLLSLAIMSSAAALLIIGVIISLL